MKRVAVLLLALAGHSIAAAPPEGSQAASEAAVVLIRTPTGGGTGFLAKVDGKTYIVTNQHVLMGVDAPDVRITFIDGTKANPTKAEIAGDLDLARLEIASPRRPLECAPGNPRNGDAVLAIGNSLDAGVITTGAGTIQGVGENEIETDCDFVPGNSGGPILDRQGRVLGVATYIRIGEKNPTTEGTRYAKGRRFAVRLRDGLKWTPVAPWKPYAQAGAAIEDSRTLGEEVFTAAQAIATHADPTHFKPKNPAVISAISDYVRLQTRLAKMDGKPVTEQELQRNNGILATTYRMAFQKLRDACASSMHDMQLRKLPPEWGWLDKERKASIEHLKSLYDLLDDESKKKPTFLTF